MVRHFDENRVAIAPGALRPVLAQWPTGVAVVTTTSLDGTRLGMTASSFAGVSMEPPLVLVSLAKTSYTRGPLLAAAVFAVTILAKDQAHVGKRFARFDPDAPDRFASGDWRSAVTGSPVLADSLGWLDCRVTATHDEGDHTVIVGEVLAAETPRLTAPLVYHSRTWGQFADLLPDAVHLLPCSQDTAVRVSAAVRPDLAALDGTRPAVLVDAFTAAPDAVVAALEAVGSAAPASLVLADPRGDASPVAVREVCREALLRARGVPVAVRLSDARGLGLANLLVALKSGVHRVEVGGDALTPEQAGLLVARLGLPLQEEMP